MTLKNLEQRYNEKVNQLYRGATTKFEGGKPGGGTNADPLNPRRVGDESFGRISQALGRFLPVARATQDTIRLTKFLASVRGAVFLGKQQLLQTGNTFEITRLLNPVFVLGAAAAPGVGNVVRIRRHLKPFNTLLSRTDTDYPEVRKLGLLQVSTWDKNFLNPITNQFVLSDLKPASPFNAKKNIGDVDGFGYDSAGFKRTRPELKDYIGTIHNDVETYNTFKFGGIVGKRNTYGAVNSGRNANTTYGGNNYALYYRNGGMATLFDYGKPLITPTTTDPNVVRSNIISDIGNASALKNYATGSADLATQIQTYTDGLPSAAERPSYLQYNTDSSNRPVTGRRTASTILGAYADLPTVGTQADGTTPIPAFDDPILVSFAMGKDDHVQFRSYIKNLKQTSTPQYKDYQYIGRIEKFISYVTVQRDVSFDLKVLAFHPDELQTVWKRINYLTGMVYPYGINRGILQPNIIRFTIGKIYVNQPGYVTSMDTTFTGNDDVGEAWDIDEQVTHGATISMKFSLIEKSTALSTTPLYGITEGINGFQRVLTLKSAPAGEEPSTVRMVTEPATAPAEEGGD